MKPWRQTLGARFGYLQYDSIQLHDLQKDLPMMVDENSNYTHSQLKLKK